MKIHLFDTNKETGLTYYRQVEVDDTWFQGNLQELLGQDQFPQNTTQPWHTAGGKVHVQVFSQGCIECQYGDPDNPESVTLRAGDTAVWQDGSMPGHRAITGDPFAGELDYAALSTHYLLKERIEA